jgi:3-hydroxybutyryl-CoA dehydrogenase
VIAMIINEAYFALGDAISTPAEIDTAMKLGTNYPYGPFEWGEKIGLLQVYQLLAKLAEDNSRYTAAPALKQALLPQY